MRRMGVLALLVVTTACARPSSYVPRNGDIVFQESRSQQSRAIQIATGSRYSHMGIVYVRDGRPFVFEAVEPVKTTPLDEWTARGVGGHFVAKRLRHAERILDPHTLAMMRAIGRSFDGRHYDLRFQWSDDRLYCSELVWKIYDRGAGIDLAPLQRFGDFAIDDPVVRAKLFERFGSSVPEDEPVVSPAAIFDSPLLETVYAE